MALKPLLPLSQIGKKPENQPWESSGMAAKRPTNCGLCRWGYKTSGFVPTFVGSDPKLGLVFTSPDSGEVVEQEALNSDRGRRFLKLYIEPYGLTRENLVVSYCLRCLAPFDRKTRARAYPSGTMRVNAEAVCSRYDRLHGKEGEMVTGGIVGWNPDVFIFSLDPEDTLKVPAYTRLIQRCIEKGLHMFNCGYKPVVLLGEEAVMLQCPWIKQEGAGGLKAWLGHYVEAPWKGAPDAEFQAKKNAFLK